jgi:hypothetical protein
MNCEEFDRRLSEADGLEELHSTEEVRAHLEMCDRCRSILTWMQGPQPSFVDHSQHNARMSQILKQDLSPVSPLPSSTLLVGGLLAIAIAVVATFAGLMGSRGLQLMTARQIATLSIAGLCVAISLCVVLLWCIRPGAPRRLPPAAALGALLLGYPLLAMASFPLGPSEHHFAEGIRCFLAGVLTAGISTYAVSVLMRRGHALNAPLSGAVFGGIGGLIAVVALQIFCPDLEALHLAVWHGLTIAASVAGGAVLGGRLTHT